MIDLEVDHFAGFETSVRWLHNGWGDPNHHLTISVCRGRGKDSTELLFDFRDDLFPSPFRESAVDQYLRVLAQVCSEQVDRVRDVSVATPIDEWFLKQNKTKSEVIEKSKE